MTTACDPDTREATLERAAERIRLTRHKLSAYSAYLAEGRDRLEREVLAATEQIDRTSVAELHIEAAAGAMGMTEVFVGVIVVAIIGNAAEHSTAVLMALKDKMDLAVTIAVASQPWTALHSAVAASSAAAAAGSGGSS